MCPAAECQWALGRQAVRTGYWEGAATAPSSTGLEENELHRATGSGTPNKSIVPVPLFPADSQDTLSSPRRRQPQPPRPLAPLLGTEEAQPSLAEEGRAALYDFVAVLDAARSAATGEEAVASARGVLSAAAASGLSALERERTTSRRTPSATPSAEVAAAAISSAGGMAAAALAWRRSDSPPLPLSVLLAHRLLLRRCAPPDAALLDGYARVADPLAARKLLDEMPGRGLVPTSLALKDILDKDVENDCVKKQGSHSRNLRRVRLGLGLIKALFEQFLATEGCSLYDAATTAYGQVCAPFHSWAIRKAVGAGMYTLPSREQLIVRLNETDSSVQKEMRRYINASSPIIEYIDNLFLSRKISLDW